MAQHEISNSAVASAAIDAASAAGATYADIRISRRLSQFVHAREQTPLSATDRRTHGLGVRVLAGGAWGFAASTSVTPEEGALCARRAVEIAKANSRLIETPVTLAPSTPVQAVWATPVVRDPFDVPAGEKLELLLAINAEAMRTARVKFCQSMIYSTREQKFFASSEGASIDQNICRIWPEFKATAVSSDGADFQSRRSLAAPVGAGYEAVTSLDLLGEAARAGVEAAAKLDAPPLVPGRRDLILMPSMLWLVIHESIGHATELDRILGYEANFAGTSFVGADQIGKLQYASPIVNVIGERTRPNGLATVGFDDEGVAASQFDIIKSGVLAGLQTIREQAHIIGDAASHGCAFADSYATTPLQRMPNISLLPGKSALTREDLIAGVEDGLLIEGDGSWSIDQQRRNFQFGGQLGYSIKNGKVDSLVRDFAFQSNTLEFWNSCDAIGGPDTFELYGTYFCGKGQPCQAAPVSHGSSPARFRNVNTINTAKC
ncbi:MAG: TldD/PmbA family protein [Capsulimonadaceae bacterium]|nr:TldD/PmbA family protein [Capsulimonadaceae bacterium]